MSQDSLLQEQVLAALAWEPGVTAGHIGVTAKNGVVTLSGHVDNYMQKHAAETAAARVKGVKAVAEELKVKLVLDVKRSDEDIAAAAIQRLDWNVLVPRDAVRVKVENGWVTLTGNVDWQFERDAARQDIGQLFGVVGVSNNVSIKPRVNASNLSTDITNALDRAWFYDTDNKVKVSAQGGKVKLTGTVASWNERDMAASLAWAAPGATAVENDISVR